MKHIPEALHRRILSTILIGIGLLLVSLCYFFATDDYILLILGFIVFICCSIKSFNIFSIVQKKQYEIIEGTCTSVSSPIIGRIKKITVLDCNGLETTIKLNKNVRFNIGDEYKFYFVITHQFSTGNNYVDTALATDNLLAIEHK